MIVKCGKFIYYKHVRSDGISRIHQILKGVSQMGRKFYALYHGTNTVLVFDTSNERDEYVKEEKMVHPECKRIAEEKIVHLIKGKTPTYDSGFGCMAIIS